MNDSSVYGPVLVQFALSDLRRCVTMLPQALCMTCATEADVGDRGHLGGLDGVISGVDCRRRPVGGGALPGLAAVSPLHADRGPLQPRRGRSVAVGRPGRQHRVGGHLAAAPNAPTQLVGRLRRRALRQLRRVSRSLLVQRPPRPLRRPPVQPTCRLPGVQRALLPAAVPQPAAGSRVHRGPIHSRLLPAPSPNLLLPQSRP